jgi:tetratricopeptide (TPR) repeat protein
MIVRAHKENQSTADRLESSKKSIEYAKKAINLDIKDSESWCILILCLDVNANSYLNSAFVSDKQYDDLKYAMNSYNFSEKYQKDYINPDLFYNRGIVHSYLENYDLAYNDFIKANEIDKNLSADALAENIIQNITLANKLIKNQCTIKPKRLAQIMNSIPTNVKDNILYTLSQIDKLILGENTNKLISAKGIQVNKNIFEVPLYIISN